MAAWIRAGLELESGSAAGSSSAGDELMIRDPSDGTVREKPMPGSEPGMAGKTPVIKSDTSGLATDKLKADEIERLKASREWVKNWHQRKTEG